MDDRIAKIVEALEKAQKHHTTTSMPRAIERYGSTEAMGVAGAKVWNELVPAAIAAARSLAQPAQPMAWVRLCSDGAYEGPLMDAHIEDVRKRSGAWTPLYFGPLPAQPISAASLYVECRECQDCEHAGINDAHLNSACNTCGWSGPAPKEDRCPNCESEGTMTTACPKCSSGRYTIVAETTLQIAGSATGAEGVQEPIEQRAFACGVLADGGWECECGQCGATAGATQPGMKLVPLEPTDEMLGAVLPVFNRINAMNESIGHKREPLTDAQIYRAMVDAAPEAAGAAGAAQPAAQEGQAMDDAAMLDWVIAHRNHRVQGSDKKGWAVLDCSDGLIFTTKGQPTYRDAIRAAASITSKND